MNSKKYIQFVAPSLLAVAVIGFGFKILTPDESYEELSDGQKTLVRQQAKKADRSQPQNIDFATVEDSSVFIENVDERLRLIANRNDLSAYSDDEILAAVSDPRVWDFSAAGSPDDLPLDTSEKEDGRKFFHASPARVAISIPGDVLEVSLPELDQPLFLEVAQAGTPRDGLVALSGTVQGMDGTFNMTQGNNVVAGHINTSTNTYSFEIFDDTGWIHESGALFTGELPPVVDTDHHEHTVHSTLGAQGEHIIAKGNSANDGIVNIDAQLEGADAQE